MKTLILIVAYEAETHIETLFQRINNTNLNPNEYEILLIDDASKDKTYEKANEASSKTLLKTTILKNPQNLGYGGNQKIGYHYAIRENLDHVVLLHGDCQYPPEFIPNVIEPLIKKEAEAVFGSRMLNKTEALKGKMPLYKWIGNQILSYLQSQLLGIKLSEFHSGFRAYSTSLLRKIPFQYNDDDFHFDADIIIQTHRNQSTIVEIPIPTHYGKEICRVNGISYAINCLKSGLEDFLTQKEIFYCRKFDLQSHPNYTSKLDLDNSSHQLATNLVKPNSKVVDLGGGNSVTTQALLNKGCEITIVDNFFTEETLQNYSNHEKVKLLHCDIQTLKEIPEGNVVMLLDIIEHIPRKEQFILLEKIRTMAKSNQPKIIISIPNSVFLPVRIMSTLGRINYGRKGILDETHHFLFTRHSIKELLTSAGYTIETQLATNAPVELVIKNKTVGQTLHTFQKWASNILPGMFAYQFIVVATPKPSVDYLLHLAEKTKSLKN